MHTWIESMTMTKATKTTTSRTTAKSATKEAMTTMMTTTKKTMMMTKDKTPTRMTTKLTTKRSTAMTATRADNDNKNDRPSLYSSALLPSGRGRERDIYIERERGDRQSEREGTTLRRYLPVTFR